MGQGQGQGQEQNLSLGLGLGHGLPPLGCHNVSFSSLGGTGASSPVTPTFEFSNKSSIKVEQELELELDPEFDKNQTNDNKIEQKNILCRNIEIEKDCNNGNQPLPLLASSTCSSTSFTTSVSTSLPSSTVSIVGTRLKKVECSGSDSDRSLSLSPSLKVLNCNLHENTHTAATTIVAASRTCVSTVGSIDDQQIGLDYAFLYDSPLSDISLQGQVLSETMNNNNNKISGNIYDENNKNNDNSNDNNNTHVIPSVSSSDFSKAERTYSDNKSISSFSFSSLNNGNAYQQHSLPLPLPLSPSSISHSTITLSHSSLPLSNSSLPLSHSSLEEDSDFSGFSNIWSQEVEPNTNIWDKQTINPDTVTSFLPSSLPLSSPLSSPFLSSLSLPLFDDITTSCSGTPFSTSFHVPPLYCSDVTMIEKKKKKCKDKKIIEVRSTNMTVATIPSSFSSSPSFSSSSSTSASSSTSFASSYALSKTSTQPIVKYEAINAIKIEMTDNSTTSFSTSNYFSESDDIFPLDRTKCQKYIISSHSPSSSSSSSSFSSSSSSSSSFPSSTTAPISLLNNMKFQNNTQIPNLVLGPTPHPSTTSDLSDEDFGPTGTGQGQGPGQGQGQGQCLDFLSVRKRRKLNTIVPNPRKPRTADYMCANCSEVR